MKRVVKKPDDRKEELLNIALRLFLTHGFDGTSVKDIYSQANGSFGMFYHHFESKEAIYKEAMSKYVNTFLCSIKNILLNTSAPFQQRYNDVILLYIEFLNGRDRVCGYKRTDLDMSVFRFLSLTVLNESIPVIQKFIEAGREAGLLAFDDSETTATFVIYGVYGMIRRQSLSETHNKNAAVMLQNLSSFIASLLGADPVLFKFEFPSKGNEV